MLIIAQVLKENCFKNHGFCSFTNNKQNKAFNDSARVDGQDRKKTARSGPEPIRLQDLENSARSLTKKKINVVIYGTSDVSKVKIAREISYS